MSEVLSSSMVVYDIPLEKIFCDQSWNCRGVISGADVVELAKSIAKDGLQQAIVVMPYHKDNYIYKVVEGHRRYIAHKQLKMETIQSTINTTITELDARVLNLTENLQRKSLNIMQEAIGIEPLLRAGWTYQEIAKRLDTSTGWVSVRRQLLTLEPEIQQVAAAGLLSAQHIKDIAAIPSKNLRFDTVKRIKDARIRGEKPQIPKKPVNKDPTKKRRQSPENIFDMSEHIAEIIGYCFATRCLAWTNGEIADIELYRDLKEEAEILGKTYKLPEDVSEFKALLEK